MLGLPQRSWAGSVHADDGSWSVYWNQPNQNMTISGKEQWDVRNALREPIKALGAGDLMTRAAAKFAGRRTAGLVLRDLDTALHRGATVKLILDKSIDTSKTWSNRSLDLLAATYGPAFSMIKSPETAPGRMHHKVVLFDYAGTAPGHTTAWTASADLGQRRVQPPGRDRHALRRQCRAVRCIQR